MTPDFNELESHLSSKDKPPSSLGSTIFFFILYSVVGIVVGSAFITAAFILLTFE